MDTETFWVTVYFEAQIWGFLAVAALVFYFIARDRGRKRTWFGQHQKAATTLLGVITLAWLMVFYGSFIEPALITTTRATVSVGRLKEPIRIALIGDTHVGPYTKTAFIRRVVNKVRALHPDLVFLAGDYVTSYTRPGDIKYLAPFAELAREIPTYAVLGNHDQGIGETPELILLPEWSEQMYNTLTDLGITVLQDETETISVRNDELLLIGMNDIPEDPHAAAELLAGEEHDKPWIGLGHHPEFVISLAPQGIDLYLTGHTHGGQIRLPFIGPLPPLPTVLGRAYDQGIRFWGNMPMFMTRGVGVTGARARLFAPPEIGLITIK